MVVLGSIFIELVFAKLSKMEPPVGIEPTT